MNKTLLSALCLLAINTVNAQELPTVAVIQPELAQQIATKAYRNCFDKGATPSVSIVDQQGTLLYFKRGEDIGPHSAKTSFRKAYTAATLRTPTSVFASIIDQPKLSQLAKMDDDILLLNGGLPITNNGQVIGGIGMSGAPSPELEEQCAADALASLLK